MFPRRLKESGPGPPTRRRERPGLSYWFSFWVWLSPSRLGHVNPCIRALFFSLKCILLEKCLSSPSQLTLSLLCNVCAQQSKGRAFVNFYPLWCTCWSTWLLGLSSHSCLFIIQNFSRYHRREEWAVTALLIDSSSTGQSVILDWFIETRGWNGYKWALESLWNGNPGSAIYSWAGQIVWCFVERHYSRFSICKLAYLPKLICKPTINTVCIFMVVNGYTRTHKGLQNLSYPHPGCWLK